MANPGQIVKVLTQIRQHAQNLGRDLDVNDSKEETKTDLEQLNSGFEQLKTLFSSIKKSDWEKLQSEVNELTTGKQTFVEYFNDVNKIVSEITSRSKNESSTNKKITQNLPGQFKGKDAGSLLEGFSSVLNAISKMTK